ncbi:DUF2155 domain-containing protein [Rhodobacter sp. KR11]|uniref:DUF2155 domain-containing protein n=1 Tax=Rhodobacter sp. KR11 TaxID=2974588 RepID=UPI002222AE87|nr:DUF2155 domain-containing protein [Rhodobacter sp. KR11]MCW1919423.1 DUF2155 domain-containing protein [Rhodobacter sp. KR11]
MIRAAVLVLLLAAPALAEQTQARGGNLRVLDRMSDKVEDLHLDLGGQGVVGKLMVTLDDCRYPQGEPSGSIAHITVHQDAITDPVFAGWMSASSPALNPMDHPRYDVWLLQCDVPAAEAG